MQFGGGGFGDLDVPALLEDRHPRQAAARVKRALAGDPEGAVAFAAALLPHLEQGRGAHRACKRAAALVLHGAEAANPDAFRGGRLSRPFRRLLTETVRAAGAGGVKGGPPPSELARTRARIDNLYRKIVRVYP